MMITLFGAYALVDTSGRLPLVEFATGGEVESWTRPRLARPAGDEADDDDEDDDDNDDELVSFDTAVTGTSCARVPRASRSSGSVEA